MLSKGIWKELKKTQKLIWGFITPAVMIAFISLSFIWTFLFRIGREDLFLQAVTFKELLSPLAFFSTVSILLYMFIFFIQSFIATLILRRHVKNFEKYKEDKSNYLLAFVFSSLISSVMLYSISYFLPGYYGKDHGWVVPAEFVLTATINIVICFLLNNSLIDRRTLLMTKTEKRFFKLKYHITFPFLLGVASWCFVFPLGLLLKFIDFEPGTNMVIQIASLGILTFLIILFSLLPGIAFLTMPVSFKVPVQLIFITLAAITAIVLSSIIAPVIPVQIINLSMKLSGTTKYDNYYYALPKKNYPSKMFEYKEWSLRESKNDEHYIVEGFSLFSFGTISLICPVNTSGAIEKSMKFIVFNSDYDAKLRSELSKATAKCNVIIKGDFKSWRA